MRRNIITFCAILLAGGITAVAQSSGQNYIVTTVPFQAVSSYTALNDSTASANANTAIQYFDGLGRPSETVQKDITPAGADLVTGMMYDAYGRDSLHWLPGATAVGNNGAYVSNYATLASSTNGNDANPYSRTDYEASPLNRVTGQYGPGADWYTNGKKVTTAYLTNGTSDVKYFYVSNNSLIGDNYYAPATLYGLQTTDEDGKTVEVFTDKQGRKVLSCVNGNTNTYYVYDDLNNLRYVLPPLASDALGGAGLNTYNETNTTLDLYGYIYHYDGRNRCVMKKLPGCDSICMVYDHADRLILSQDGNQRQKGQWTVNKYDVFGRIVYTGKRTSSQSRSTLQGILDPLVVTESYVGASGFANTGYSCSYFINEITPLTVNYYDGYGFLKLLDGTTKGQLGPVNQSGYTFPDTLHVKTLLTGTRVYHLDNPTKYEVTSIYYDKYGHVVQTRATNHLGGYDITCNLVDFTGKPTATYTTHSINGTTVSASELYHYTYDKAQRLLTITSNINNSGTVPLVTNTYDKLGRLQAKVMGGTVDTTSYTYNVRSWLTSITGSHFTENLYYETNPANLSTFSPCYNGNIAGMQWSVPAESLGYNRSYIFSYDGLNRLTNGIYCGFSGSVVSGTTDRYDETYGYDKMGNITNFVRYGLQTNTPAMSYGMIDNLTLAHNGNQLTKVTDNGSDGLYYGDEEYQVNTANSGNCRAYDANGNTLYDTNSDIWGIRYNLLNLPDSIQFYQGHQTLYSYSAAGTKLQVVDKTAPDGVTIPVTNLDTVLTNPTVLSTITTDYVGDAIYRNDTLLRILLPTGYWQGNTYYYYLKDHLGSNREVLSQTRQVVEYSDYYPSGMRFGESVVNGDNVQPYRHTGMEMQGMHGLNWIDNQARMRSVNVPEFTTVDPLCELYCSISPYAYCQEDPINKTDPDGRGVNDNNLLPEVTITAATPESDESNYIQYDLYQQLLGSARTNINQLHKPRLMNLSSNININNVISSMPILKDNKASNNTLETISTAISAIGISSDNVKIAVREFGGEQIVYVTLKGTDAAVSVVKVASALKAIGVSAFFLGVIADVGLSATGQQSWAKTLVDTGISAAAITIGGVPGVIIGAGYMFLDKLGAFDRPDIQCNYNPGVCPQDVTKTVISNYTH